MQWKVAWKQRHKKKKTWLKLWASERNVSPSESELIKDFISIWWCPREKYFFFFNPLSVLKAKYQAKAFRVMPKKICFEGDTAILRLCQTTDNGVNRAKPVGYFSVTRNWQPMLIVSSAEWENQMHYQIVLFFFQFLQWKGALRSLDR